MYFRNRLQDTTFSSTHIQLSNPQNTALQLKGVHIMAAQNKSEEMRVCVRSKRSKTEIAFLQRYRSTGCN